MENLWWGFIICIIVGFVAQFIDSVAGMAYGVSCRTFLGVFLKLPAALCSALVHIAELPLSIVSGISHLSMRNVDKKLFFVLLIPGVIGAAIGAAMVSFYTTWVEVLVAVYLVLVGIKIIVQALFVRGPIAPNPTWVNAVVATIGGFFDAFGGGGWGPIVTATLIQGEERPQKIVGTVNTVEFAVTAVQLLFFGIFLSVIKDYLIYVAAIIIGGLIAAPIGAKMCVKMEKKALLLVVGFLIIALNVINLVKSLS